MESLQNSEIKSVKPRVGKNLPQVLSRNLVKDWYSAISELACNSYDADSENVNINLDSGLAQLVIQDDGSGMDEKGLDDFFRLADSSKIDEPISPIKKRRRIGKYGIAKVLIQYLGNSYSVESVKDGKRYIIDEGVSENIIVKSFPVSKEVKSGTTITIKDLRFDVNKGNFNLNKLYSKLQWELPSVPDFDVFLNGLYVKKRAGITYSRIYEVDKLIGEARVHGRIYVSKSNKSKLNGIRIYVNRRSVGSPDLFDIKAISRSLINRVQGEINADFLEDIITLDRSDFQDDERLDKTIEAVKEVLYSIKQDIDNGQSKREKYTQRTTINPVIDSSIIEAQEVLRRSTGKNYTLELTDNKNAGEISRLDEDKDIIYINSENKLFSILDKKHKSKFRKLSEIHLKRAFLIASSLAICKQETNSMGYENYLSKRANEIFKDYSCIVNSVSDSRNESILIPLNKIHFNPYRLYDHYELSNLTGRHTNLIRLLHTSGSLKGSEDHLFSQKNILESLSQIEGYLSCVEIANPKYTPGYNNDNFNMRRVQYTKKKASDIDLALMIKTPDNFDLINVGIFHPLFFVKTEQKEDFFKYTKKNNLYVGIADE